MSEPSRQPRVFAPDDPSLVVESDAQVPADAVSDAGLEGARRVRSTVAEIAGGAWSWGWMLVAALAGAAALSALAWLAGYVSVALARNDWIGWATLACLVVAAFSTLMIFLRELVGLSRVSRLTHLRAEIDAAIADRNAKRERRVAQRIAGLYAGRRAMAWNVRRFRDHVGDVHDSGELLALAEREMMLPLDAEARGLITRSAKRVATVTALSPAAIIDVGYVLYENLRLLRLLATLYGARPGFAGAMRLGRMVLTHIVATGGLAMTDDLLGQFLGQDLLRRLSRRLGEGAFNGALTARIGLTALEVIRPMPFRTARAPRLRDVLAEAIKPLFTRKAEGS